MSETLASPTASVVVPPVEFLVRLEAAALLRVSGATLDRLVRKDKSFPAPIKFGGAKILYRRSALLEYLASHESREPVEVRARRFRQQPQKGTKAEKRARK